MFRIFLEHDGQSWLGFSNFGEVEIVVLWIEQARAERFIVPILPSLDGPPIVDGTAQRAGAPRG